jgi:hypothetical protein
MNPTVLVKKIVLTVFAKKGIINIPQLIVMIVSLLSAGSFMGIPVSVMTFLFQTLNFANGLFETQDTMRAIALAIEKGLTTVF